ncbi:CobW/HypB/UreG, nucleotide-binding domain-containing protein [Dunaliella salina]|uniref:CobW/HypB/UreG, nucleotide-binding domain-containing protein n=1 Tax=Dunaliella salina TaxID=3046 RepID=A0ABQ7GZN3_DUNSA|nr:CobW/HypB/UreG, nucleotide-binding domain-containing protein [Dunaliella salina]|eukprot:KAF5840067.1 CobW/HypB/UreG, nucleotide-binding domain-containing protein [Dunaliella salina]
MPHLHLPKEAEKQRVPVTVITGFLGSGKSTLLNHILRWSQRSDVDKSGVSRRNIAVIENEFGEISIDKTIVGDQLLERENLVSMEGGCVCCSLRKDVVKAFAELERRAKAKNTAHDHILLETTGLADPSPLAFTFFANPWIAARFKLDSIVCVVDSKHLLQHVVEYQPGGDVNEAVQQLAFADLILLNKVDLVDEESKMEVMAAIKHINNTAKIVECRLSGDSLLLPSMERILDSNTFSVSRALEVDPQFMDSDSASESCDEEGDGRKQPQEKSALPPQGSDQQQQPQQQQQQQQQQQALLPPGHLESSNSQARGTPTESRPGTQGQQQQGTCEICREQHQHSEQHQQHQQQQYPDHQPRRCGCGCAERSAKAGGQSSIVGGSKRSLQQAEPQLLQKHEKEKRPKRRRKLLHDTSDISSVGFQAHGTLDEYRFNMFMRDLLTEKAKDIYRCKGVLAVHGYGNKKFVFQGVHETICYGPADHPWKEGEVPVNQIVFIGRDLDRKALVQGFRTCVWSPLPEGWVQTTDPKTGQPFYWNKDTNEKSWLRPLLTNPPPLSIHTTCTFAASHLRSPSSGTRTHASGHGCAPKPPPSCGSTMHPLSNPSG